MPITHWPHYADHPLALTCRSRNGSYMPVGDKGYTFQTVLGSMGLNHMNGRVQDAVTGVFLSADATIPAPGNTMNYHHMGYANHNPLTYTDPSGFASTTNARLPKDGPETNPSSIFVYRLDGSGGLDGLSGDACYGGLSDEIDLQALTASLDAITANLSSQLDSMISGLTPPAPTFSNISLPDASESGTEY